MATLAELDTVYSTEDVYNMIEIVMVEIHNQRAARKFALAKQRQG